MSSAFQDPSADSTPLQWTPSSGTTHFNLVNGGARQPTAPSLANKVTVTPGHTWTDTYLLGTGIPTIGSNVASIVLWIYCSAPTVSTFTAAINQSGTFLTAQSLTNGTATWQSLTFSPAGGFSQTDLNNLAVQLNGTGISNSVIVYETYATYTYTNANIAITIADSISITDTLVINSGISINENISITDTLVINADISINETISISDSVLTSITGTSVSINENISINDIIEIQDNEIQINTIRHRGIKR